MNSYHRKWASLNDLGKIIFYLLATVVLGALLAPPLYWGANWLASHGIQPWLAELHFRKFFHRGLLIAAVGLLWPTVKWISLPGLEGLGLQPNPRRKQDLLVGFLASFLIMVGLALVLMQLEIYRVRKEIQWGPLGSVMVSAVVVSVLEEGLFRGAIFGLVARAINKWWSLFFVSALYSILHFLKPQEKLPEGHTVGWLSGFELIPGAFSQFQEPWLVLGGFSTLFVVGLILGYARIRTASLWMPIGLHAGWILGKMGLSKIARRRITDTLPWLGEDITIGLASLFVVTLTGVLIYFWLRRRRPLAPICTSTHCRCKNPDNETDDETQALPPSVGGRVS